MIHEVAKVTKGKFTLIHSWYRDEMGLKRNAFLVEEELPLTPTNRRGKGILYPFIGKLRPNKMTSADPYEGDDTTPYTMEEYLEMLDEQIRKIDGGTEGASY